MDYRALLKKYMAGVIAAEGVSFIDHHVGMGQREPTAKERAELKAIERELVSEEQ